MFLILIKQEISELRMLYQLRNYRSSLQYMKHLKIKLLLFHDICQG